MKTKKKTIANILSVFILIIVLLLIFTACDSLELKKYKKSKSEELKTYAESMGQNNYSPENWQELLRIIEEGLLKIKDATDKETVDSLYYEYFSSIARVKPYPKDKPIQPMIGAEEYAGGSGTEDNPFVILTKGQLIHFSNQINIGENNEACFILGADIDLESMKWNPIGLLGYNRFSGVFDGKGYEIANLHISERKINSAAGNIGLFGLNDGIIKNLGVVGIDIDISWSYTYGVNMSTYVGGLVGNNSGEILNCYVRGNISLEYNGYATHFSPNNILAGSLTVGGKNIKNCYSIVNMDVKYLYEHGIIRLSGLALGAQVENCFIAGSITWDYQGCSTYSNSKEFFGNKWKNCYIYEETLFNGEAKLMSIPNHISCSSNDLNTASFYTDKLAWDEAIWDFDNLDFDAGLLPKLRKIKDGFSE
ncbi:MAG: GLUG motif-containing protein [Christensenellales bacterium]|jgi:hypothetical protein